MWMMRCGESGLTSAVFAAFQTASGDTHPVHYDVEYCRARGMPDLLAHGFQTLVYPVWNQKKSGIIGTPELVSAGSAYAADVFAKLRLPCTRLKAPVKVFADAPPRTNVPVPVFVKLAPPTESLMTPESVAKSPVELGLSST